MSELNQQLGGSIKQVRSDRGLTQSEFAKRLGTSQSAVNRIEHGKQNLSIKTLQRISAVLDYEFLSLNDPDGPKVEISENPKTGQLTVRIDR